MPIAPGTVIATIPAGVATSIASGLPNEASTSIDNTVTYLPYTSLGVEYPFYLTVVGDMIAVGGAFEPEGLYVADATDAENLVLRGLLPSTLFDPTGEYSQEFGNHQGDTDGTYYLEGGYQDLPSVDYVGFLNVIDITSDPDNPVLVGRYSETSPNAAVIGSCYAGGTLAALAIQLEARVRLISFATPTAPVSVGSVVDAIHLDTVYLVASVTANLLVAGGRHNFSGTFRSTFALIDISTPSAPVVVGFMPTGVPGDYFSFDFQVIDSSTVLISTFDGNSILTVDISTPSSPIITNTFTHPYISGAYDMTVLSNGNLLLASNFNNRLITIDISDPHDPQYISQTPVYDPTSPVEINGRVVVASAEGQNLYSFPLSVFA